MNGEDLSNSVEILKRQINHKMVDQNLKRPQLAEKAGISSDTLDNLWKTSRKKPLYADDLYKVSKVLNCSMEELITGHEERKEESTIEKKISEKPVLAKIIDQLSGLDNEELSRVSDALIGVLVGLKVSQKGESSGMMSA